VPPRAGADVGDVAVKPELRGLAKVEAREYRRVQHCLTRPFANGAVYMTRRVLLYGGLDCVRIS
jgi:hypothetical protein